MLMLLSFTLLVIIAGGTGFLAKRRGRDAVGWFLIGLLLGIFALILLFILPAHQPKTQVDLDPDEDRLLKIGGASPDMGLYCCDWFYLDDSHKQCGPVSLDGLRACWDEGDLTLETLVWRQGMEKWARVKELYELKEALEPAAQIT